MALVLLAALAPLAAAQTDECRSNPTLEACRDYRVPEAVLERDLSSLCAGSALGGASYTGWPSACSLWHECKAGRAAAGACQPLALLQTACNDLMGEASQCQEYILLCAPQSVVRQCTEQAPVHSLRPSVQYMTQVQKMCGNASLAAAGSVANASLEAGGGAGAAAGIDAALLEAACANCSARSPSEDKVVVQATEANCPDPLATLATLCLAAPEGDARNESCAAWLEFCDSEAGVGFPWLCGGDTNATAAGVAAEAAPAPATDGGDAADTKAPAAGGSASPDRAPAAGLTQPDCYAKPQQDKCRGFQQSDATSRANIEQLCGAVPSMVGCTLWQQCAGGAASGAYCQPFSVLGTLCWPNPALAGCQGWAALCNTPGSVVQQCVTAAPIRNAVLTSQTMDAVAAGCASANGSKVPGCEQCAAAGQNSSSCEQPLAVMSQLCRDSPALQQCSTFAAMCAEAGGTFSSLCSSGSGGGAVATDGMGGSSSSGSNGGSGLDKMWLHASMTARILFYSWVPTSSGAYIASCLAVMAAAVAVQGLKALHTLAEARWAAEAAAANALRGSGNSSPAPSTCEGATGGDHRRSSAMSSVPMLRASLNASGFHRSSMSEPGTLAPLPSPPAGFVTREELARNTGRAAFTGCLIFCEYMLMLVAMTFNLGLILSLTIGFALGALAFGHFKERAAAASAHQVPAGVVLGSIINNPAAGGADLEIQYGQ